MSTLTTNQQPARMAINRKDVAELVDVLVTETIKRLDAREQHKMISNAVQQGVAKHLEAQRTAAKPAEPEDIFANYTIEGDAESAASYLNSIIQEGTK